MRVLNRDERKTLRSVQAHISAATLHGPVVVEQLGTVDVYFHPTNADPYLNCVTPHRGVAWVRREDLLDAFGGLERLGRTPRLVFQDALFPAAFRQQVELMGLELEEQRPVMVYRPIYGPHLPGETPRGCLPETSGEQIATTVAATPAELATWLRVFRAGYFNTEALQIDPNDVEPLHDSASQGISVFVLATYENTPLGAAHIALNPPTAELEAVVTAPLWHGMGLEVALITTAVRTVLLRGCSIIFTIAPPLMRLYRRLGFTELTNMLSFWQAENYENPNTAESEESKS
jgi:GNAT superfamily N-acetyltransferase